MERNRIRENRLRRAARRQGLGLEKCRYRDPRALGYGRYRLVDIKRGIVVAGGDPWDYSLDLDGVEEYLLGERVST